MRAWQLWIVALLALAGLLSAARARAAEPSGFRACGQAMTADQVHRLFRELESVSGRDGCKLEDVSTKRSATRVTWSVQGVKLPPALVAPRGCLVSPDLEGRQLQGAVPPVVQKTCPTSYAKLRTLLARRVGNLAPAHKAGEAAARLGVVPVIVCLVALALLLLLAIVLPRLWHRSLLGVKGRWWLLFGMCAFLLAITSLQEAGVVVRPGVVSVTVAVFVLSLLLAVALAIRGLSRREPLGVEGRRWLLLGTAAFLLALLLRLSVRPSLANWYTIMLPASGAMDGRFGPGGLVLQRALSLVLPWTDRTLFTANAVIGSFAVAVAVGIARERRMPLAAAGALAVFFALAPLHVRISASPSEHVLASTLALVALWLWLRAQRLDSSLQGGLALLLLGGAVLTRAEIWIQLAAIGLWGVLRDPEERALDTRGRRRFALVFAAVWMLVGVYAYFAIVVPSQHPGPDLRGIENAAGQLLAQYWHVAFSQPRWVSPLAVLLALPGTVFLFVRRRWLLLGIALFLALAFVPLGRDLQHDGLLGARYFLATLPVFLMLPACGLYACGRGIAGVLRRLPRLPRLAGVTRVQQAVTALLLLVVGLGDWSLSKSAYRARYTFQDEYDFLRGALARVPDGCTVTSVPIRSKRYHRDLDCCLEMDLSPLSIVYPHLHFASLDKPGEIDGPGCRYYYESSVCSIDLPRAEISAVDRPAIRIIRRECRQARTAPLSLLAGTRVSPRSTNGYFDGHAPEVRLFRVGRAPSRR